MVDLLSRLNSFLVNRESRLDFPTPESPINTTGRGSKCQPTAVAIYEAPELVVPNTFEEELNSH